MERFEKKKTHRIRIRNCNLLPGGKKKYNDHPYNNRQPITKNLLHISSINDLVLQKHSLSYPDKIMPWRDFVGDCLYRLIHHLKNHELKNCFLNTSARDNNAEPMPINRNVMMNTLYDRARSMATDDVAVLSSLAPRISPSSPFLPDDVLV